jgi:hypothetical protein
MSLIQLVATGAENNHFRLASNLATEYFTEDFINNSLEIVRHCDTKCPEYLEIELSPNIDGDNFKQICHKVCFELEIGGQRLLNIPLRFMINLNGFELSDNKYYIKIPFEMFFDDIKLICLQYHLVKIRLTNAENYFRMCRLISKGIYYSDEIRRNIAQNSHNSIVQQLSSIEINYSNERNDFSIYTEFNGIHKGFFIEAENIYGINFTVKKLKYIINNLILIISYSLAFISIAT